MSPPQRKIPVIGDEDLSIWQARTGKFVTPILPQRAANMPAAAVVAELQRYAASVGLTLTCRCTRCGSPLWNAKSISRKLGPTCRRRIAPGATK